MNFLLVFLCLIKYSQSELISRSTNDFEKEVNVALGRDFQRLALFDQLIQKIGKQPGFRASIIKVELKNGLTNIKNELEVYYNQLKNESLTTKILPDLYKSMFEVKILDIAPSQINKSVTNIINDLEFEPTLTRSDKTNISRDISKVAHLVQTDFISPLKSEIETHPEEYKIVDPFLYLTEGGKVDEEKRTPEINTAYGRLDEITAKFLIENGPFFTSFHRDMEKYGQILGVQDFFPSKEELVSRE